MKLVTALKKSKNNVPLWAFILSSLSYLVFYYPTLTGDIVLGGSDATYLHYPSRYYLYETLKSGHFPFWTERIFSGFPIYADIERAYLNPVNILSVLLFGPFLSYKVLHLGFYLAGSFGLFKFLKTKGGNLYGFFAANLVYFFSFFHLYHQQHFNMVLVTYLIPLNIYLSQLFVSRKQSRYLFLNSLLALVSIYFGSLQAVVLVLLPQLLYIFVWLKDLKLKQTIISVGLYLLLLVALSLPALVPAYYLYTTSQRAETGVSFVQGSFTPFMAVNAIYPFFFGVDESYKANMISSDFQIHETYFYIGISSVILAFLGQLVLKDKMLRRFLAYLVGVALIFSFIGFIPFVEKLPIPVISAFRYWGRTTVLFNFAIAVLVGVFLSNVESLNANALLQKLRQKKTYYPIYMIAMYLGTLELLNFGNPKTLIIARLLLGKVFNFDQYFILWSVVLFSTLLTFYLVFRYAKKHTFSILFCSIIALDIIGFGSTVSKSYFRNLNDIYYPFVDATTAEFATRRIVYKGNLLGWNLGLYDKSWGIFGYSQFAPSNYLAYMKELGFKSSKKLYAGHDLSYVTPELLSSSANLGVTEIIDENDSIRKLSKKSQYPLIRNYIGWKILINGNSVLPTSSEDDLFLSYEVSSQDSIVELTYVPVHFYYGIAAMSFFTIILSGLASYLQKKELIYEF